MLKKYKARFLLAFSLLLVLPMQASLVHASSGWTDYAQVVELVPTIHHRYKVRIAVTENNSGCKQQQWFYQDYDISGSRQMFDTLLRAIADDKSVRVYVTGRCNIDDYSEISAVSIRP